MRQGRLDHDLDAEAALLGAALVAPEMVPELVTIVAPEDFFRTEHELIWKAVTWLNSKGHKADLVTVVNTLDRFNKMEAVGGRAFVSELVDACPDVANSPQYAKIIADLSMLRSLKYAIGQANHADDGEEALEIVQNAVDSVLSKRKMGETRHLGEVAAETAALARKIHSGEVTIVGTETGIDCIDRKIHMLGAGQLCVLAGRPGMGKTAMACTIARNIALRGQTCLFESLEMTSEEVTARILSGVAAVDSQVFTTGKGVDMSFPDDWALIEAAVTRLKGTRVIIDDGSGFNPSRIRAMAKRVKAMEGGLDMIIIDYLQLMDADSPHGSRDEQIGRITKALKRLGVELRTPVLLLAQLNRSSEKEERDPRLSDLRESGRIEQDADKVFFLAPTEHSPDGTFIKAIVAKNRQGACGDEYVRFDKRTSTMVSAGITDIIGGRD